MPTPQDSLIVWPPAPTNARAREEFHFGYLFVTHAETLTIRNPYIWRLWIGLLLFQTLIAGHGWISSFQIWLHFHQLFGTPGPVWNDPFFRGQMVSNTKVYALMMLSYLLFFWFMYVIVHAKGVTIFRTSAVAEIGGRSGHVLSLTIRPMKTLRTTTYVISVNMDTKTESAWNKIRPTFTFRSPEDANKFAELLAEFMNVPMIPAS